ncbi:hypothetical protein [Obesumbacterium proteus]|uniref:hypothetical protein n=1 Tax=Obesumbacterium proteus TaxID=82983 RepID=UPI001F293F36|nr:hypothetical protein [Obesumbacterium proteus]MCE9884164.1 hypothetical protein [Obesumbacterium proteus]MCE9916712.1 hypothetical protein [Obesumbacterium proteus]MCE9930664.1 hypothetical protein [Obesumbacterium proteus]MCG2876658.1 hypothetical protein [Obesumbacterium proteus]
MVTAVPTGGTLGITHYNEIERASSKNDVLTVRSNGKENYLVAGRSLAERFIIVLNSTCLGSLGFIKSLYEALERREAQAISCFSSALVNIYGEDAKNIVDTHLQGNGKIKSSDICTIVDRVTKESSSYRSCDNRDKAIEAKIKLSFQDFDLSHVNNCDFDLFDNLSNEVDGLISNIGGRERFSNEEKVHHLKTALMDFITSMPASSDTFMAAFSHVENDVVAPEYHINDINLNKNSRVYLTAENMSTLLQGAGLLKEELLLSEVQDACRHQVYAARFNEGAGNVDPASRGLPSVPLNSPRGDVVGAMASSLPPLSLRVPPPPPYTGHSAPPLPPPTLLQQSPLPQQSLPVPPTLPPKPLANYVPPPPSQKPLSLNVPPPPPPPLPSIVSVEASKNNQVDKNQANSSNKVNTRVLSGADFTSELQEKIKERFNKAKNSESDDSAKKKLIQN